MADLLDPDEDAGLLASLVVLERYDGRATRDDALARMHRRASTRRTEGPASPGRDQFAMDAERLFCKAAGLAAPRLEQRAARDGLSTIKESHLQKEFKVSLQERAAEARPRPTVSPRLGHGLKHEWPRLGLFDISLAWDNVEAFGELKCGEDVVTLSACGWDAAKEAFCLQHGVGVAAFLVAAAPAALWQARVLGLELFFDGQWDMANIRDRYATGFTRWERDGFKPTYVFRRLRTFDLGRSQSFGVGSKPWLIGVARVEPIDDEQMDWQPFLPTQV